MIVRVFVFAALIGALLAGCAERTPLPQQGIRAGLNGDQLIKLVGRDPTKQSRFELPDQPGARYLVFEYYLAPRKNAPDEKYWFLFADQQGLIGYGSGGEENAKSLAYHSYFEWLAEHDVLPRAKAEAQYLKRLQTLFGARLNPLVTDLFAIRIAVMTEVDGKKLDAKKAESVIHGRFAKRLGRRQYRAIYGNQKTPFDRYVALSRIGLDVNRSATLTAPAASAKNGIVSCAELRAVGGGRIRCY